MNEDSMAAQKSPAFQLYVKDYLADTNLRVCSLAARGLWMDLLCHMWLSERRGFLLIGGRKPTTEQLARIVGADSAEVATLLEELARNDVYSVDDAGVIHSRRIVRDDQRRQQNILNGSKGGNPNLLKLRDKQADRAADKGGISKRVESVGGSVNPPANRPVKAGVIPEVTPNPTPAFASASAVSAAAGGCAEPPPPAAEARPADTSARVVAALEAAGIANPTLDELAALPGITPEMITAEARLANQRGKGVGALVLNIRASVQKAKRKPAQRDRIGREEKGRELEQIRRQQELEAEADRQFDALGADVIEAYRREALQVCEFGTPGARAKAASADPKTHPIIRKFIDDRAREGRTPVRESSSPCHDDPEKRFASAASEREVDAALQGLEDETIEELRQSAVERISRDFPGLVGRVRKADPRTDPLLRRYIAVAAQKRSREAVPA